jgi:hypothetical protein
MIAGQSYHSRPGENNDDRNADVPWRGRHCHAQARIAVDCGMFQGPKTLKELNYQPLRPAGMDAA